jgi:hypothetical protein
MGREPLEVIIRNWILGHGPWVYKTTLVVLNHFPLEFLANKEEHLTYLIWLEFLGLPMKFWLAIWFIVSHLVEFIYKEPKLFFSTQCQHCIYMRIKLSNDLKDIVSI